MKRLILVLGRRRCGRVGRGRARDAGQGQTSTILSSGAMKGDVAYNTGLATTTERTHLGRQAVLGRPAAGVPAEASARGRHEPRRVAEPASGDRGEVRDGAGRDPALPGGRHPAGDVRSRCGTRAGTAIPGYLDSDGRLGPGRPLGTDCSSQTFAAGQTFYRPGRAVHRQERGKRGRGRCGHVRRPGRHADRPALRIEPAQPTTCSK